MNSILLMTTLCLAQLSIQPAPERIHPFSYSDEPLAIRLDGLTGNERDLKITIGSVVPHPSAGFGGGSKIVLPGIVSFETILWNHSMRQKTAREQKDKPIPGFGIFDENPMHFDNDEAAKLVGLDMVINCILNTWGETVSLYAGDMDAVHTAAVKDGKANYLTPKVTGKDIVIANTYAKVNEARLGLAIAYPTLNKGGDVVLIANAPEGQATHYLLGPFGKTTWAIQHNRYQVPEHVHRLIVFSEYPHRGSSWLDENEKIIYLDKWDDVVSCLQESQGSDAKVAVYPNSEIQYCAR